MGCIWGAIFCIWEDVKVDTGVSVRWLTFQTFVYGLSSHLVRGQREAVRITSVFCIRYLLWVLFLFFNQLFAMKFSIKLYFCNFESFAFKCTFKMILSHWNFPHHGCCNSRLFLVKFCHFCQWSQPPPAVFRHEISGCAGSWRA